LPKHFFEHSAQQFFSEHLPKHVFEFSSQQLFSEHLPKHVFKHSPQQLFLSIYLKMFSGIQLSSFFEHLP
jgi:hypothetical protein